MARKRSKRLIILRGLPGTGKSDEASAIVEAYGSGEIFSTDDYFRDDNWSMDARFRTKDLNQAHMWNRMRVLEAIKEGVHPVVVDNTNLRIWEMWPYVRMGFRRGYWIEFVDVDGFHFSLEDRYIYCGLKIPFEKLEEMERSYEPVRNIWTVLNNHYSCAMWMPSGERMLNRW